MTTFTLTVDDRAAERIRHIVAQMLDWATEQQVISSSTSPPSDKVTLETRQTQIRQIFERNEW